MIPNFDFQGAHEKEAFTQAQTNPSAIYTKCTHCERPLLGFHLSQLAPAAKFRFPPIVSRQQSTESRTEPHTLEIVVNLVSSAVKR